MIEERARVLSSKGNEVWVEAVRSSACGACSVRSGCGQELMQRLGANKALHIKVRYSGPVVPGDQVVLGVDEGTLLKSSLLVWALPLFTFILAVTFAHEFLEWSEPRVVGVGLLGLMSGFVLPLFYGRMVGSRSSPEPVILRVL